MPHGTRIGVSRARKAHLDAVDKNGVYTGAMDNDFVIPPDMPPVKREAILKIKAAIERFVEKSNRKLFYWATIESQEQMEKEIKNIIASYPTGMFGIPSGSGLKLSEKRVYEGFVIAVHACPRENGKYSTLSGIRKSGDPGSQEPFLISEQEFPTHEAAIKAAFEENIEKIEASFAA